MRKSTNSLIMIYPLIKLTDQVSDNTRSGFCGGQVDFLTNTNVPQLSFLKYMHK